MAKLKPTWHEDFEINQRVKYDLYGNNNQDYVGEGTIIGISSMYMEFHYIVLLDNPMYIPDYKEKARAISISGTRLESLSKHRQLIWEKEQQHNVPEVWHADPYTIVIYNDSFDHSKPYKLFLHNWGIIAEFTTLISAQTAAQSHWDENS